MKIKLVLSFLIVFAVAFLVASQAKQIVAAEAKNKPGVTPLTSPVTYVTLRGLVQYRVYKGYQPAENVSITIMRKNGTAVIGTKTNQAGQFQIALPPDYYTVSAADSFGTQFDPPSVKLYLGVDTSLYFVGKMPPHDVK